MKKVNVLIFPCGSEPALNIYDSLKYNLHFEIFGATNKHDHAEYVFDKEHLSIDQYNINENNFFEKFNKLIDRFNIEYIFSTHDEIVYFLIRNQSKIKATIVSSPKETCEIAYSKIKTFEKLDGCTFLPKWYRALDSIEYPVFVKPNHGAGGKGTFLAKTRKDFESINISDYLISENLPGEELTVDCFTNKNRELVFIGPRTRERITNGVSYRSQNVELTDEIKNIAKEINRRIEFRGLWFFQIKKDIKDKFKLMEICVRTAGTMSLYRMLGINFASLSLYDFMGYEDLSLLRNSFHIQLDRFNQPYYKVDLDYDYIYIDFDDTVITNTKVNLDVITFLYQALNNGKKVCLITKHMENIHSSLKKYKISEDIFEDIVSIDKKEKKSDYIKRKKAIFIDNYFFDRKDVFENCGIPVFDVDTVQALIERY